MFVLISLVTQGAFQSAGEDNFEGGRDKERVGGVHPAGPIQHLEAGT